METQATPTTPREVGLYIHVAFCKTKCFYCDFNTYAGLERLIEPYARALEAEIAGLPQQLPGVAAPPSERFRIGSIFFGGGTPSLLAPGYLEGILGAARVWPIADDAEITLEANPDDLHLAYLQALRALGINRLSLGVQSFDDEMLRRLGRRHDSATAIAAIEQARQAGFANVSIDLMFALPDQSLAHWEATIDRALALRPDHLSLYNLTIEPETPYHTWVAKGKLTVPDDDQAADMYQAAIDRLGTAGYHHYEISNWAWIDDPRDLRAQHNLRYWRNQEYFGVGAGAHSSYQGYRYADLRLPAPYIQRVQRGESPVESVEPIGRKLAMGETMMLGLRLAEGVDLAGFRARFGRAPADVYGPTITELTTSGLITANDRYLALTARGKFLGNEVFRRFLVEA